MIDLYRLIMIIRRPKLTVVLVFNRININLSKPNTTILEPHQTIKNKFIKNLFIKVLTYTFVKSVF